jgi:hypothetical protein
MDGGAASGVDVRIEASMGVSGAARTDAAGRFRIDVSQGTYRLVARLQGFRPRTWLDVHAGDIGEMAIQPVNTCDEMATAERAVRVVDRDDSPVAAALVTSNCGSCWTISNGSCAVMVPVNTDVRTPALTSAIWASHRDYQAGTTGGTNQNVVRLSRRIQTPVRTTSPTVRVVTAWSTWIMELTGQNSLVGRFLTDVGAHRFDDWIAYVDNRTGALTFRTYGHQWAIRPTSTSQVMLSLAGETGEIAGRIADGRIDDQFGAPSQFARAVPVLEVTRVQ